MGHIQLQQLQHMLFTHPVLLSEITLHQIFSFITLISWLKDNIIHTQPPQHQQFWLWLLSILSLAVVTSQQVELIISGKY
jgi:hypothetical protein